MEYLQKTFNPSEELTPNNIEQYLYINLSRLEDTYYNLQNRHPDICHAFECCENPKATTSYDLKRIKSVIYNDLINIWHSKDSPINEDERLENIHKMLDCIESSSNHVIAILKRLMQLKNELYVKDNILGKIKKECTYSPLKI